MDPFETEQGSGWAQVAPLILTRQREIAERLAAANAPTEQTRNLPNTRLVRVDPTRNATASAQSKSGENGLGGQNAPLSRTGADAKGDVKTDARGLTEAEQKMVVELKARDAEVRRHEQAHAAVGGQYAGAPTYTYQTGPDGRRYAVGGAVAIDVAPVDGDPDATINKMEVVKAAALAPAEPSAADRRVAALADTQRAQAIADLAAMRSAERAEVLDQRM